ncbi:MAG: PqqD family protein [Nitrospirae bacterium]|nr:MAG: PqqD family protein [Nitrospirota bacterium]
MDLSADSILRKNEKVVFRKLGGEYVLVPLSSSVADVEAIFNLNETGAFVWERIDGRRRLGEILEEMKAEYEDDGRLEADAIAFVAEMLEAKLLEV